MFKTPHPMRSTSGASYQADACYRSSQVTKNKCSEIRKYQKPSNTYNTHIIILFFTCYSFRPLLAKPNNIIRVKKLIPFELQEQ